MINTPGPHGNVDLDQVNEWISTLYGGAEGYIHICSTLNWAGRAFDSADLDGINSYISDLDRQGAKGIYARVTTLQQPRIKGRGSDTDSQEFVGLWADIDIAGPGHKHQVCPPDCSKQHTHVTLTLPATQAEAMRIVEEAQLPEPTLWVHSGGGMYPWWLLKNPFSVTDPEVLIRTQDISARWQQVLRSAAERLGYAYGPVGDLSRVMRIPGTVNRKVEDNPVYCTMMPDLASGRLYTANELRLALGAAEAYAQSVRPAQAAVMTGVSQGPSCEHGYTVYRDRHPNGKPCSSASPTTSSDQTGGRPGDELANRMSWAEILEPHGYQFDRRQGEEEYWVRPEKNRRDGHSCTTNYGGSNLLYVFSTEMAGFEAGSSYSKFATWSILNGYGLTFREAAKALRSQGYGSQQQPTPSPRPFQPGQVADGGGEAPPEGSGSQVVVLHDSFLLSDVGNARRLAATVGDRFRYVKEWSQWLRWDGTVWKADNTSAVMRAAVGVTDEILREANALQDTLEDHDEEAQVCRCKGCKLAKHGVTSQHNTRIKGMVEQFSMMENIAVEATDFDQDKEWVTLNNGSLSLRTGQLGAFDPRKMLTKKLNAAFDPEAKCPKFEAFMQQVLPSAAVRDYVQRALGYTLTGENDQRALFLVHGPSGTGKSQFLSIFERLFGDFGGTAESNTFRVRRGESTHELHALRGQRFVTTSETSESAKLDEELVKRITGGDNVTTRALYQGHITWRPEFTIWMATNFPPRMNSDDGAVWARYKPIEFSQVFSRTEGDVPNIGKRIFEEEASGILNWLLAGLAAYRQRGLGEPQEVVDQAAEHRMESDNVSQFLRDSIEDGRLVEDTSERVKSSLLYAAYERWCAQEHQPALGQRRFSQRLSTLGYEKVRSNGWNWVGLKLAPHAGVLGSMY